MHRQMTAIRKTGKKKPCPMKKRILAMIVTLAIHCTVARAASCVICDGDGVCDTCDGLGYMEMQAYGSDDTVLVVCPADWKNGRCSACGATITVEPGVDLAQAHTFVDAAVEDAVCGILGKAKGEVTYQDLLSVTALECMNAGCSNVSNLQYMTNLTELTLSGNQISDISALAGLTNSSALKGLSKLEYLYLMDDEKNEIAPK